MATTTDDMVAYYDMKTAPITFDFCHYIAAASGYAQTLGKSDFDLTIVADAYRNVTPREKAYTMVERQWRLWNLTFEITKIVPHLRNISVMQRPMKTVSATAYPPGYHPVTNNNIPYSVQTCIQLHKHGCNMRIFRPSAYAVRAAEKLVPRTPGKKIITITVRKAGHDPSRDSSLDDWDKFIKILDERGYQVVVIPDQDDSLSDRTTLKYGWNVLEVTSMSLDLRLALYHHADMNYVTNGGMIGLFIYSTAPFMWFSVIVPGSPVASPEYYKNQGLDYGHKYPWLDDRQEMIWEPDTLPNLVASLDRIK
jgi:hypothetical protein